VMCQAVPESNQRLHKLMEHYQELMKKHGEKLPNAVGILAVSDAQKTDDTLQDLKRIDIKIIWNPPELDANRQLVFDQAADGSRVPKLVIVERPTNEQEVLEGVKKPASAVQSSGKQVFVNRKSEYSASAGGH
jgi:hypothetical protein